LIALSSGPIPSLFAKSLINPEKEFGIRAKSGCNMKTTRASNSANNIYPNDMSTGASIFMQQNQSKVEKTQVEEWGNLHENTIGNISYSDVVASQTKMSIIPKDGDNIIAFGVTAFHYW